MIENYVNNQIINTYNIYLQKINEQAFLYWMSKRTAVRTFIIEKGLHNPTEMKKRIPLHPTIIQIANQKAGLGGSPRGLEIGE